MKITLTIALIGLLLTSSCSRKAPRNGAQGTPGTSCTVEQMDNGMIMHCGDGTSAVAMNGVNGNDGTNGSNGTDGRDAVVPFSIKGYIYPCANESSNKEMFLRMSDNTIIGVYDGGAGLSHLAVLQPGNYVTTDGFTCNINIDARGNVTTSPVAATGLATVGQ